MMTAQQPQPTTDYYSKANFNFLILLWLHLPIALFTAWMCHHGLIFAGAVSLAILALPSIIFARNRRSLETSIAMAMALVCFSALLIDVSGGMVEMHFHVFCSLGIMITLAQPLAVIAALLVVVVHHVGFFFLLPSSLINYQASFGILVIHAIFALATGVPSIFISKKFKLYIVSVKSIINEVQEISEQLGSASEMMFGTSSSLTTSTTKEAAAMQQTAAALEQLRAMIAKNSQNAQTTATSSEDSRQKSQMGQQVVERVVGSLNEIKANSEEILEAVGRSNARVSEIVGVIQDIGSKTRVINDIVFQTKLLSFNASVEAARAGENGKGFAVVAEEVGKLARLSGDSAKEITQLLEASLRNVESIILETKSHVDGRVAAGQIKIAQGMQIALECKQVLSDIYINVGHTASVASEIAAASREQSAGVNEISRAVAEVENSTQMNSGAASRAMSIAEDLTTGSNRLRVAVESLVSAVERGAVVPLTVQARAIQDHADGEMVPNAPPFLRTAEKAA